jgi:hypothetical protein
MVRIFLSEAISPTRGHKDFAQYCESLRIYVWSGQVFPCSVEALDLELDDGPIEVDPG